MEGNNPDDNDVWTPPESTQEPYPSDNNVVYTSGSVTYPASSSGHYATGTHFEQYQPDDARDVSTGNEAMSSYSAIQAPDGAQLIAAPSVVSSSLHQSGFPMHQVVLSSDHRVLTVQRVISPVDCTVSQSSLSLQESQPTHALLTPVSKISYSDQ
ncbi:hypothetical protein KUTeg_001071 [Tegillarca granosa]|uniref:Uncharacterized protein n=1 Tax=Tegillarca granosa TaxID=220873 RepID=A0ABQ9FW12_TEGGR|nr:hypothetical protein KUTeg_001071 [Tegillarca granosa]